MTDPQALATEVEEQRAAFFASLAGLSAERRASKDVINGWSERELVAHMGYWAGHCTEAIHLVELGRGAEFEAEPQGDDDTVDTRNATVARIARETSLESVRAREAAAAEALLARLRSLDPALLTEKLPDGDTLEAQIRVDGPDHYREHADELLGR